MSTYVAGNAEEREVRTFVKTIAQWVWPPVVSFLACSYLFRLLNEFEFFSRIIPDPMPGLFKQMMAPNSWVLFLLSLFFVVFMRRVRVPEVAVRRVTVGGHAIDLFRLSLAGFFFIYAFIVARGMVPLPDQAPRIEFRGVFCVTAGMVIAWQCLVGRYRLFLVGSWLFILWIGLPQIEKREKFLEMMLEPTTVVVVTQYGLGLVLLLLMTPRAMQTFSLSSVEYQPDQPMFFKKGLPF